MIALLSKLKTCNSFIFFLTTKPNSNIQDAVADYFGF